MGDGSPNVTRFAPPLASAQREKLARHGVWVPTIQWSTPHFNTPLGCGENWRGPEFSRALEIFGRALYETYISHYRQILGFSWLAQQLFAEGTPSHPAVMAMDAWSDGDTFVIEFDLPGVRHDAVEIAVERNVLPVTAQRPTP